MATEETKTEMLYEIPGQHQFEGVYYAGSTPDSLIEKIRDDFPFGQGDVLIATYPKSGWSIFLYVWLWLTNLTA